MLRLYQRHAVRKTTLLDGMWRFKTDEGRSGLSGGWNKSLPGDAQDMPVPSCWNNELGLYAYEGLAWYETEITTAKETVNLVFGAVTGQAEVYLDGRHLGGHYGGFTRFEFLVRGLTAGKHTLTVSVDNTHDDFNTLPLSKVDWYHYGGITRSVEMMELEDAWIKSCRIGYAFENGGKDVRLDFTVTLENLRTQALSRSLRIRLGDAALSSIPVQWQGETTVKATGRIQNVRRWDVGSPNLYTVHFDIGDDDLMERTGFREIRAENKKILLNGRELFIKGVNRHEEHPDWGFAFPLKLMKKDLEIVKDLGCNAVRGAHYPNSELFLDYCDQVGVLFWEEIPLWGFPEEVIKNPVIRERGLHMLEEMVTRDNPHPSIIIWGLHNEIDTSTQAAYDLTEAFAAKVKSLDNSRLLAYASNHGLNDVCFSLVDVICINQYNGWYEGGLETWPAFLKELKEKLRKDGQDQKPLLLSEFGAGGIYGDCTFEGPKWTENYQETYLDYTIRLFMADKDISGMYVWQLCDIRTARELELGRPRSFNNKGLMNEYRKPKMAYWAVKKLFHGQCETDSDAEPRR